jgi:hypothetical protein
MTSLTLLFLSLCVFWLSFELPFAQAIQCYEYRVAEMEPSPTNIPIFTCKPGVQFCVKHVVMYEYNNGGTEGTTQMRTRGRCAYSEGECVEDGCVQLPPTDIMGIKKTDINCCSSQDLTNASSTLLARVSLPVAAILLLCLIFTS